MGESFNRCMKIAEVYSSALYNNLAKTCGNSHSFWKVPSLLRNFYILDYSTKCDLVYFYVSNRDKLWNCYNIRNILDFLCSNLGVEVAKKYLLSNILKDYYDL